MGIITSCMLGLVFTIIGFVLMKYPPEHINNSLGYKTPFAMKNEETWNEGNRFCGKVLMIGGIVFIPFSIIFKYIYRNDLAISMRISAVALVIIVIGGIAYTEVHLRMVFNSAGIRK